MTILRASASWLTSLAAIAASPPAPSMPPYAFAPVGPPSQLGASNPPSGVTLNAAGQAIAGLGTNVDSWITIQPWAVRQLAGVNGASMPAEPLQLSKECAGDFRGSWPAVFTALGFTPFTPGANSVPTLGC